MGNIADIVIVVLLALAAYAGRRRGTIKQLSGLVGIIVGVFVAAYFYDLLAFLTESSVIRTVVLAIILLATSFLSYDICTMLGTRLQTRFVPKKFMGSLPDTIGSAVVSMGGSMLLIWFAALIFGAVLPQAAKAQVEGSAILSAANRYVATPRIITNIAQILQPFAAPDVFVGQEPTFEDTPSTLSQQFGSLDTAVARATSGIVKVSTWGCGSTTVGSGFMVDKRLFVTNAHVVAGADRVTVQNNGVTNVAKAVWFDPKLDVAVLLTETDMPGQPLTVKAESLAPGTIGAVLGYPGGTAFMAGDVIVLQSLEANGYDIYRQSTVVRQVYAVRGEVVPGNSGGPLINSQGIVVGLIFGHAVNQNKTGYAIAAGQLLGGIQAARAGTTATTGSCLSS